MTLKEAANVLNTELVKHRPSRFTGTWVFQHTPRVYRFARLNLRTVTGEIDWDALNRYLDRDLQSRWVGRRRKRRIYEDPAEVEKVLSRYRPRLYIFIAPQNRSDENLRDRISIRLVRIAQRGNTLALQEARTLIRYVVDEWVERFWTLSRWKYRSGQLDDQIEGCILRYRFTGSFLGYLYKTLLYAGRGLPSTYSLDQPIAYGSTKTRSENVVQDPETGEIKMYEKGMFAL